jgi:hypothetical protein
MKVFRIRFVVNLFTLFTGVIFLNMSFVLAEISALRIDRNSEMAHSLSILVANSMAEEEPGAADEDSTLSGLDLIVNHHGHVGAIDQYSSIKFNVWSHGHPKLGEFEICKPPPEA